MNTAVQLFDFLMDLHRHPVGMGGRLVFVIVGTLWTFGGTIVIYGCLAPPLAVQGRSWWQRAYPPPVPKPFNYPVRALYMLMGAFSIVMGVAFLFELFV
jgi:hypothetical protein